MLSECGADGQRADDCREGRGKVSDAVAKTHRQKRKSEGRRGPKI